MLAGVATDKHDGFRPRRTVNVANDSFQDFRVADRRQIVEYLVAMVISANIAIRTSSGASCTDM
jgi:hypothetical protein